MAQQFTTPPTNDSTLPQAADNPTITTHTPSRASDEMSNAQAVEMMRRWAEDAQTDPEQHSSFIKVARIFIDTLTAEATREKQHRARGTGHLKSYEVQPIGTPQAVATTLDPNDSYTVFRAVLHAVQTWEADERVLPNEAAHRALIEATQALAIMARAQLAEMTPIVQAHRDDNAAAQEWADDRWMGRTDPKRAPAGSIVATNATEGEES